ncbi:MAG: hypothetical protein LAO31_12350 [Acidobacteriia bacterium]|nr:hypothetical protein [Terriglobia bacterium]
MRNTIILFVVTFLVLASGLAGAPASNTSPQERQAILNYQLTLPRANQLITAMEAMTKYVVSLPDFQERVRKSMTMTGEERRAQLEKDPKAMAIVKQNGLTAQDYLVGVPALRMALWAAQGRANDSNLIVSPANLAFAKTNLDQLKPKMDKADGIVRQK